MSDEAKPDVYVEPQPSAHAQSDREWMVSATRRAEEANRAERAAEESARAERGAGASAPVAAKPAPRPPAAPKPAEPSGLSAQERSEARRLAQRVRELEADNARHVQQWQPVEQNIEKIRRGVALLDQIEDGNFDGAAQTLGFKEWRDVDGHFVSTISDPSYQRLRTVERQIRERDEREQRAQQEHAARVQAQQQQAAQAQYKQRMAAEAKRSSSPIIREFAAAPAFIEALFEARGAHFQRTGEELALEACLDVKRPNGLSIVEEMENYSTTADVYRRARGATPQVKAETARAKAASKAKPESETRYGWQPSAKRDEDTEWLARGRRDLTRAFGEERRREGR